MTPDNASSLRWSLSLAGLFLFTLAVLILSGPGRIDIIDGQARYLTARGLVDHGDPAIRDPDFWFTVLPGRDGKRYSNYRFTGSVAGVPAIALSDWTGPVNDLRRQFYFSLVGSFAGASLAVVYALWFRSLGQSSRRALAWALGNLLHPELVLRYQHLRRSARHLPRRRRLRAGLVGQAKAPLLGALLSGSSLGLAFNSKPPLGVFLLPLLALLLTAPRPWRTRLSGSLLLLGGLGAGLLAYLGYEWYKYPPGTTGEHAHILARYVPPWPGNTLAGACGLLLSPSAGVFWYCPPLLLGLGGLFAWRRKEPWLCGSLALSTAIFFLFISSLSFFKGDLCWGPRYMTPVFALAWLFVPAGAALWPRRLTTQLLVVGLAVQLLGLSVDPLRLFVHHKLPSGFFFGNEWLYFHPGLSNLANRPREIVEICSADKAEIIAFSPSPIPTSTPPLLEEMERGPGAIRKYGFLNLFRPWWASLGWLPPGQRPVDLASTVLLLLGLALGGLGLMAFGTRGGSGPPASAVRESSSQGTLCAVP